MPGNELKQRKIPLQGNNTGAVDQTLHQTSEKREKKAGDKLRIAFGGAEKSSAFTIDIKMCVCLFSTVVCLGLAWIVLRQNARFSDLEEKYGFLSRKTGDLLELHGEVSRISQKLDSVEDDLLGMLSSVSRVDELEQEIPSLHVAVLAERNAESSEAVSVGPVSARFRNVMESHQLGLEGVVGGLGALRVETRSSHAQTSERVNKADTQLRTLEERLEELEAATQRNIRALERSEDEDVLHVRERVEWNAQWMRPLEQRQRGLAERDTEIHGKLEELTPRIRWCEGQLPTVEEAVHSILHLSANMISVQQRVQKLTLQVRQLEESIPKATSEILAMQKVLDRENDNFESLPDVLGRLEGQLVRAQVEKLKVDVEELKRWMASVVEKRERQQADMMELTQAIQHMEENAATVAKDAAAQVALARTDMRRMSGLGAEAEALLARVTVLEGRVTQTETAMAKRIGDQLAGSIERVSALRGISERNSQAVEKLWRGVAELEEADGELAGRLLALEDSRARLLKTVTFASDLKPKVAAIRQELAALEPLLSDLTLRVGHLAQDLGRREGDVALLWDAVTNLSTSK